MTNRLSLLLRATLGLGLLAVALLSLASVPRSYSAPPAMRWVVTAEALLSCGTSASALRHLPRTARLAVVGVGIDPRQLAAFVARERVRAADLQVMSEREYRRRYRSAAAAGVYLLDGSGGVRLLPAAGSAGSGAAGTSGGGASSAVPAQGKAQGLWRDIDGSYWCGATCSPNQRCCAVVLTPDTVRPRPAPPPSRSR